MAKPTTKALEELTQNLEKRHKEKQAMIREKIIELDNKAALLTEKITEKRQEVVSLELTGGETEDLKTEIGKLRFELSDIGEQREAYVAFQYNIPQEDIEQVRLLAKEISEEISDREAALQAELDKISGKITVLEQKKEQIKHDLAYLGFNAVSDPLDQISYLICPEAMTFGTFKRKRFWRDFINGKDVTSYFQN